MEIKYILVFVGLYWNELNPIEKVSGGGKRDRTADLLHAMQALSQLSYTPPHRVMLTAPCEINRCITVSLAV